MSTRRAWDLVGWAAAAVLACALQARAELVWHPEAGWVDTAAAPERSPDGLFRRSLGLLTQGAVNDALELLLRMETQPIPEDLRRKVRYYQAECRLRLGEIDRVLAICDQLFAEPLSQELRDRVRSLQFRAAQELGRQDPVRGSQSLRHVLDREPDGPLASAVRLELADRALQMRDHDTARSLYLRVLQSSPPEAFAARAGFGAGWADLLYCRDVRHDDQRLDHATEQLREHLKRFPNAADADKTRECIWVCGSLRREQFVERRGVFHAVIGILSGDDEKAYSALKAAAGKYKGTYMGEAARFYLGEYWFARKEHWKAFKYYEDLMEEYPGNIRTRQVVDREFEIGRQLMAYSGKWRDWMLWRATDVFEKILEHNPSGPKAADAQMLLGDCYLERWYWEEAHEAYTALLENYPRSKWVPAARFKSGLAKFREAEFTEDKSELLIQAARALQVYVRENPSGPFAEEARQMLQRCRYREAALRWRQARLYERIRRPRAAVAVLGRIAQEYSDTVWAERARERLQAFAALGYTE